MTGSEEIQDALPMFELPLKIVACMILLLWRDELLAVIVPQRVDAGQQVCFAPIEPVAQNQPFAAAGRVEPETQESILPDRADGVLATGDQPRVTGPDRLPVQMFADPHLALAAVVEPHMGIPAIESIGTQSRTHTRPGDFLLLGEPEHGVLPVPDWYR